VPFGLGLKETFRAIPERIELSGHGSSWTVTAGSFTAAAEYAAERFGSFAITGHRLREGWWPRVTLWLTTDPADIARATAMRLERAAPLASAGMLTPTEMTSPATDGQPGNGNGNHETVVDILSLEDHTPRNRVRRTTRQAPELPPTLEGIFSRAEDRRLARRANALFVDLAEVPAVPQIPQQRRQRLLDRTSKAEARPPVTPEGDIDEPLTD
jgi:hypothetical protein